MASFSATDEKKATKLYPHHICTVNLSLPKSGLEILLSLKPDDFTRERETFWVLKG